MKQPVITVFGSSAPRPSEPEYETAYALGRAIATASWTVCNGGYCGTMEASAKGASDVGGHTIGVTCSALPMRGGANAYIKQEVPTFDLLARLNTLVRLGDGYVVLPGGTGTMLELALVWELNSKRMAPRGLPIVLLGEHWTPLDAPIRAAQPDALRLPVAATVDQAIDMLRAGLNDTTDDSPSQPA